MKTEQIEEILKEFDFISLQRMMAMPIFPVYNDDGSIKTVQEWKMLVDGNFKIPTVSELKELATTILLNVSKDSEEEASRIQQGPFEAMNWYGNLSLRFVPLEWNSND